MQLKVVFLTDIWTQLVGPIFKGQALEDGPDRMHQIISKELLLYAT